MEHMTEAKLTSLRKDPYLSLHEDCDLFNINTRYAWLVKCGYVIDVRGPYLILICGMRTWSIQDTADGRLQDRLSQTLYLVSVAERDMTERAVF